MKNYYRRFYEKFDEQRYFKLMSAFGLDEMRKIRTFSKGMKKQVSVICGVCSGADYLFCDETFDGLDPVVRQAVKSLFAEDVAERGLTPVIASHNLRELEDICDHVGLLHRGGILFSRDLDEMKLGMYKVQCIFGAPLPRGRMERLRPAQKGAARLALHHYRTRRTRRADGEDQQDEPDVLRASAADARGNLYQ